jgi:hypothetical protein
MGRVARAISPAPGARTIRMCSLDGRNRGWPEPPGLERESLRSFGGEERGAVGLVEACARWTCAVSFDQTTRPEK